MASDDTLARLKALSDRLERLRQQAREVHNVAADEVRTAHLSTEQRNMPNRTERRAVRRDQGNLAPSSAVRTAR